MLCINFERRFHYEPENQGGHDHEGSTACVVQRQLGDCDFGLQAA